MLIVGALTTRVYRLLSSEADWKAWRLICKEFHRVDSVSRFHLRVLHVEFLAVLLRNYARIESPDLSVCPRMESIDVSYCHRFGDREVATVSLAVGLRELKMDKCLELTDVGLAKIAVGCSRLEKLNLKWCLEIGDLGVDLLCKKCVDLKFLDLSYLKDSNICHDAQS